MSIVFRPVTQSGHWETRLRRKCLSNGSNAALRPSLMYNGALRWGRNGRTSTMSHGKRNSKRRNSRREGRTKALTVLGLAGALSLAGGASGAAVGPPGDDVTLHEEAISDVRLSTFYVFDHENAGARRSGLQLAQRTRSRPRQNSGGCAEDCAGGGPTCCAACRTGPGCAQ
jgi:hypothetical protein